MARDSARGVGREEGLSALIVVLVLVTYIPARSLWLPDALGVW